MKELLQKFIELILFENAGQSLVNDLRSRFEQHGIHVGKILGYGLHGVAFESGPDEVTKLSIAKDEADAKRRVRVLQQLASLKSSVTALVRDAGVLGFVNTGDTRWVHQNGVAFYYIMEKMYPLPPEEVKLATTLLNQLADDPASERKQLFVARRVFHRDGEDETIIDKVIVLFHDMQRDKIKHRDINNGALMQNSKGEYRLIDMESVEVINQMSLS